MSSAERQIEGKYIFKLDLITAPQKPHVEIMSYWYVLLQSTYVKPLPDLWVKS